ncbi:MAG: prenyltransferase [Thaumarchaeota archaeon]|nr:prenyltransferase [Nitrososphaerota archaeon]
MATAVPLLVGGALAVSGGRFSPLGWSDVFLVALLMQVGTNALNEYGDYRHEVDTVPSPGIAGVIVSGEVSASEVLIAAATCYAVAFFLGLLLVLERGVFLLILGIAAILAGVLYSEGPLPISSTSFGEVLVGVVMGPIEIVSADLAASGAISNLALVYSIPVGLMVASILLTNNLRDVDKDRDHGRRTLAVLIGRKRGSFLLLGLMLSALVWSIPAYFLYSIYASVFLVWFALPLVVRSYSHLMNGREWTTSVPRIAMIHIIIGLLLTLSIILRV